MSASGAERLVRWIWHDASPAASVCRASLVPLALLFRAGVGLKNAAYDAGVRGARRLPRPSVGVGNLTVGGTGKTPVAAWVAERLRERGLKAGFVLRGYGGDEVRELEEKGGGAAFAHPDRHRAASRAVEAGAQVLVLDDCLQRRDVAVDLMLALVSADAWGPRRWLLPAGPWREGLGALRRADAVVVTRKIAAAEAAAALARELAGLTRLGQGCVAALVPTRMYTWPGMTPAGLETLRGRDVLAVSGIGEPALFARQLEALGARVDPCVFPDHHRFSDADVAAIVARAGGRTVVTTGKDLVRLRERWPAALGALHVVLLGVTVEAGAGALADLLDRVATAART